MQFLLLRSSTGKTSTLEIESCDYVGDIIVKAKIQEEKFANLHPHR